MPKTKASVNDAELIELVKQNPELYDAKHRLASNPAHVEAVWQDIADKLNSSSDNAKKMWRKLSSNYSRRKSLRSTSIADNLSFLSLPLLELSNENSCASSACSSPKRSDKRSTRSMSQISTASEMERSRSTLASNFGASSKREWRRSASTSATRENNTSISECPSIDLDAGKYEGKKKLPEASSERERLDETSRQVDKEIQRNAVGPASRRSSGTPNAKGKPKRGAVTDPTRVFFESMAMTVSTFPQHIQAAIKMQICNIVGEKEYGLSMPQPC